MRKRGVMLAEGRVGWKRGVIGRAGRKSVDLCELTLEAASWRSLRSQNPERLGFHWSPPGSWVGGPQEPFTGTIERAPLFHRDEL